MSFFDKQFQDERQNLFKKRSTKFFTDAQTREEVQRKWLTSDEAENKGPNEIAGWRRAAREDVKQIENLQKLTGDVADLLYQKKNIHELIENCYFSIVQYDSSGAVISFTAFDSYPNIPSTPFWDDWLQKNYRVSGLNPGNVLFIHYMVWNPELEHKFLPLLLETSFVEFIRLKYIIIIKPPLTNIPEFYAHNFIPLLPLGLEELENTSIQLLLLCLRSSITKPLSIRIAFEQEMEAVVDVIERSMKRSKVTYFWDLVNLVYAKDKKTLISEIGRQLVGVMALNLKIDLDVLNEGFELSPFNGLRKKDPTNEEDFDFPIPEKIGNENRSTNFMMSSKLLLSPMNWELRQLRPKESTAAVPSESHLSQLSLFHLSSQLDLKSCHDLTGMITHRKSEIMSKMEDLNVLIRTSGSTVTHFYPPTYHGQSNAFLIDFFAIDCSKIDEKQSSFDFLEAAFRVVPDREYCILLTPTDSLHSPLLDLFVRVTPRPLASFKQELYLCHKNSLSIISMHVRPAKKRDLIDISNFLKYVNEGDLVYRDILSTCFGEKPSYKTFVLNLGERIVGVALINSTDPIEHFHMYFEVGDFESAIPYESGNRSVIEHLVINPLYHNHARFFVRDIMRLVDVTSIYYVTDTHQKSRVNLLTVLGEFVPMKPRRQVGFVKLSHLSEEDVKNMQPFGLYFLTPRLCGFRKIHMNIVIVVVGASRTALSFFENLIFGPHNCFYNFNNLICVSPHGLEGLAAGEDVQNLMFPIRDNFSRKYISMLSLDSHVSFVHGVMTGINRSQKFIVVNNKSLIRYDYLILTCGLQYLVPTPEAELKKSKPEMGKTNIQSSLARFLRRSVDRKHFNGPRNLNNMFIINTRQDAETAIRAILQLVHKNKKDGRKIIIYGHDLRSFLTINTLLKVGVPGEVIVFVEPFPSDTITVTLFNDYSVDQAVLEEVKDCKVVYYTDYFLYDWTVSSEDFITSINFHSKRKQLVIPCLAFFPFLEKLVSDVTFNACNDAGLVYDGRLVINHNFRTNDKHIYAAGPFTKYARRYYANQFNHQYYNSREVGRKLAEIIRDKVDPGKNRGADEPSSNTDELVPKLEAPVFLHCQLPGGFNLFILRKPGKELDLETDYNYYDYGEVLTTGDCKMKNGYGYFRLHLCPEGFVESITCYTKDKIDYVNLSCLYGLHERLLNNLLIRYDMSNISDFFEYFRQPWARAIFHESFKRVRETNYKAFFENVFENQNFYERVVEELEINNWKSLEDSVRQRLEEDYLHSRIQDDIKNNLRRFLEYYKEELPVYSTFSRVKDLLHKRAKP